MKVRAERRRGSTSCWAIPSNRNCPAAREEDCDGAATLQPVKTPRTGKLVTKDPWKDTSEKMCVEERQRGVFMDGLYSP